MTGIDPRELYNMLTILVLGLQLLSSMPLTAFQKKWEEKIIHQRLKVPQAGQAHVEDELIGHEVKILTFRSGDPRLREAYGELRANMEKYSTRRGKERSSRVYCLCWVYKGYLVVSAQKVQTRLKPEAGRKTSRLWHSSRPREWCRMFNALSHVIFNHIQVVVEVADPNLEYSEELRSLLADASITKVISQMIVNSFLYFIRRSSRGRTTRSSLRCARP